MAEDNQQLEQLRTGIIEKLAATGGQMADDNSIAFNDLLAIARITGQTELLNKAFTRAQALEDGPQRAAAYIDLLTEVEQRLRKSGAGDISNRNRPSPAAPTDTSNKTPSETETASVDSDKDDSDQTAKKSSDDKPTDS